MNLTDAKVYALNTATLMISFTAIEAAMKLTLLIATIGYTIHKWYIMASKNESND